MIGRQLSHFRIDGQIGAGGMGVVYRATDLRLQRTVALKVLSADAADDPGRKERFFREARAASALNHPGIVTVHDADTVEGVDFIAMELVEGRSLDELAEAGPLEVRRALDLAIQMADALARAHEAGIVHRDLKPRNVIVTEDGRAKLLDFGIAKRVGPAASPAAAPSGDGATQDLGTAAGIVVGTPHYMSPEQAQGKPVDARSDIFSFGVVLYEMLGGQRPFDADTPAAVMAAVLRDEPRPLRALRAGLPEEIVRIVAKAMEKDVEYRYQHMRDVLADLKRLRRDSESGERAATGPVAASRRRRVLAGGLAAVAVAAAAFAFAWWWSQRRPPLPRDFRLVSTFPGSHRSPSLSPDGRMIAYVDAAAGAVPQVWVRPLEQGEAVQVTTGEVAVDRPRWSPKGDQIVFSRRGQGIWSVPPLGGPARQIVKDGRCPAFFPDGERLVFERAGLLWTIRADGTEERPVAGVPFSVGASFFQRFPSVSPDGRWIAYFEPWALPMGDFEVVPVAGGEPRRLTHDTPVGGASAWTPDGRFLIVSSARGGSRTLWRLPVGGGEPEPVTTGAGEDDEPDVSADGTRLVYTNSRHSQHVILIDAAGGERLLAERRGYAGMPAFSHAGDRVGFHALTEDGVQIFSVRADGTGLVQVTRGRSGGRVAAQWSRDDAWIYYWDSGSMMLRKAPAGGGAGVDVLTAAEVGGGTQTLTQLFAKIDPQERVIGYQPWERASGPTAGFRLRDLSTRVERSLPYAMGAATWSRDGRFLVSNAGRGGLRVCAVDGSGCREIETGMPSESNRGVPHFSADGSRIYFIQAASSALDDPHLVRGEVWTIGMDGRDLRRVATLDPVLVTTGNIDVSVHDEIAWVRFQRGKQEIWRADLPRR